MEQDGFALLGLPRSLNLEEASLKDHYHAAVLGNADPDRLLTLHRAQSTLREPSRRIAHLLALHEKASAIPETPGSRLFDLFFSVSEELKKADRILSTLRAATTALQRAGFTSQLIAALGDLNLILQKVAGQTTDRLTQLSSLNQKFPDLADSEWAEVAGLGADFSFLAKWDSEIRKRQTQLQEMLLGEMA